MYALNDITIIDNFLDLQDHLSLKTLIIDNQNFYWHKSCILFTEDYKLANDLNLKYKYFADDSMYNSQMVHNVYNLLKDFNINQSNSYSNRSKSSEHIRVFQPLLKKINPESKSEYFTRVKVNMTFNWGKQIFNGYHIDETDINKTKDRMTAIYYVNTNNGYTKFERGDVVKSVANRIVIFPTHMYHSGVTATDVSARYVINLNWLDTDHKAV